MENNAASAGLTLVRSPRVALVPIHIVCCGLASLAVWLVTTLLLYLTSDYEVQFVKRLVNAVRLCGILLLLSLGILFLYPYTTQSLFINIIRAFVTVFAAGWGMFLDEHALLRWLYVLFTTGAGAIDIICVTLQADLLDCQEAQRCSTDDTTGALKMSYIRQYVALSIELLGLLYSAYVFHALGFCQSHILPDEYGIPQHLCGLAKASITRKKLEARDPRLFDKGNTHVVFDPKDPLEIKWDTFTDTVLGEERLSWPISRNNRRVSMVSEEELQYRIRILRKLGLPVDDYLKMRVERACD